LNCQNSTKKEINFLHTKEGSLERKYFLFFLLLLAIQTGFAHQDFYVTRHFGKVTIRIRTGFEYEEIRKIDILGQLVHKLSQDLNYVNPVFIDLTHCYTEHCNPAYFLSFDKGEIDYEIEGMKNPAPPLKQRGLVLRFVSSEFDALPLLQLVEYGMQNTERIDKGQKNIVFNDRYYHWKANSIDTTILQSLVREPASPAVNCVLNQRINRPETKDFDKRASPLYYLKGGKVHVYTGCYPDTTLLVLEHLYDFRRVATIYGLVFDSDSSFYFVNGFNHKPVSQRHIVHQLTDEHRLRLWEPCEVTKLGENKLAISFGNNIGTERITVYLIKEDRLVQNLDEVLKKE